MVAKKPATVKKGKESVGGGDAPVATKVEPLITPYLTFNNAKAAIELYKKAFGATIVKDQKMDDGRYLHVTLKMYGRELYFSDSQPGQEGMKAIEDCNGSLQSFMLEVDDKELKPAFDRAVKAGMTKTSDIQENFWGSRSCRVKDKFGYMWCFHTYTSLVNQTEMAKRWKTVDWTKPWDGNKPQPSKALDAHRAKLKKQIVTYLSLPKGKGKEAIAWYKKALGANVDIQLMNPDGGVGHGEMEILNNRVMFADAWTDPSIKGNSVCLTFLVPDVDGFYHKAVANGAKSLMKPEDQFWGDRWAMFVDPFGQTWSALCPIPIAQLNRAVGAAHKTAGTAAKAKKATPKKKKAPKKTAKKKAPAKKKRAGSTKKKTTKKPAAKKTKATKKKPSKPAKKKTSAKKKAPRKATAKKVKK